MQPWWRAPPWGPGAGAPRDGTRSRHLCSSLYPPGESFVFTVWGPLKRVRIQVGSSRHRKVSHFLAAGAADQIPVYNWWDYVPGVLRLATRGHWRPRFCAAASPSGSRAGQGPDWDGVGVGGAGAGGLMTQVRQLRPPPGARGEAEAWPPAHSFPPRQALWLPLHPTTGRKEGDRALALTRGHESLGRD